MPQLGNIICLPSPGWRNEKAQASTCPKYGVLVASLPAAIGPDEESRDRGKCVKVCTCTGSYVTITTHQSGGHTSPSQHTDVGQQSGSVRDVLRHCLGPHQDLLSFRALKVYFPSVRPTPTYASPSQAHKQFSLVMVLKLTGTMIILSLIQPQTWSRDQSRLRLLTWARLSFRFHELEMIFDHVACSLVSSL